MRKARIERKNKAQISRSRSGLRQLVELQGVALLVVTHGQFGRDGLEVTKEAACAVVGAGGEIEFGARRASGVVTSGGGAVAGAESPEAANGERLSGCVLDQADELTCGEIVGGNGAGTIRRSSAEKTLTEGNPRPHPGCHRDVITLSPSWLLLINELSDKRHLAS
jgi:hypothetical protein